MNTRRSILTKVAVCLCMMGAFWQIGPVRCEEGMWPPHELSDEIMRSMHAKGLELGRDEIYNSAGTGIANAIVGLGATGSFVSGEGLILTNHHVAFGAVQRMSSPGKNYIEEGFLARTKDAEVPAHGYVAYVIQSVDDVTEQVLSAVDPSMSPLERYQAIERREKELVGEAEAAGEVYCEIDEFFGGSRYLLYSYLKIKDIRVVYVPSGSIGWYGGDIDNWMWPRHTGDFSFLRAYVAPDGRLADYSGSNVPYRPKTYLRVAAEGLAEGDFSIIIGFPGKTNRYLTSHCLASYEDFEYPQRVRLYSEMVRLLEMQSAADPLAAVRVASRLKGINNRLKNNQGMLDGFRRFDIVDHQRTREAEIAERLEADPAKAAKYASLLASFEALHRKRKDHVMKDLLLGFMLDRRCLLGNAMFLYKWSIEKAKDDIERDPDFMDREIPDMKRRLRVFEMEFHPASDRALLRMLLGELAALPSGQRIEALDDILGTEPGQATPGVIDRFLDGLYGDTKLDREEERWRLFDLSHDGLIAEGDPFIDLAGKIYRESEQKIEREKALKGALTMLVPDWLEFVGEGMGGVLYPDANGTMRLNYGTVKGYSPADEVYFEPFTAVQGVAAKHTGADPFDCPERILRLAAAASYTSYIAPALGDVPVNLLTTHDSTGGNSGSPLINSRGELVGCLFDGNYEAMTSDFAFHDDVTRSISVDIRYILFIADYVDHAQNVLMELGITPAGG
jgi:hypothetical protein